MRRLRLVDSLFWVPCLYVPGVHGPGHRARTLERLRVRRWLLSLIENHDDLREWPRKIWRFDCAVALLCALLFRCFVVLLSRRSTPLTLASPGAVFLSRSRSTDASETVLAGNEPQPWSCRFFLKAFSTDKDQRDLWETDISRSQRRGVHDFRITSGFNWTQML